MVARSNRAFNAPIITFTDVMKRSIDIISDQSSNDDNSANNMLHRIGCICSNVKTEHIIESPEELMGLLDLSVVQPMMDSFLSLRLQKLLEIKPLSPKSMETKNRQSKPRFYLYWWSLLVIILAISLFFVTNYYFIEDQGHSLQLKEVKNDVEKSFMTMLSRMEREMEALIATKSSGIAAKVEQKVNDVTVVLNSIQEGLMDLRKKYEVLKEQCSVDKVESLIKTALEIYDADKTGLHDFAAESAGGTVVLDRTSATYSPSSSSFFSLSISSKKRNPFSVIQGKLGFGPGECWPFNGNTGVITIKLSQRANVTAVSYEHLSNRLNPDGNMKSAPQLFQIWAYDDENEKRTRRMLGEYIYLNTGPTLQFFKTQRFISPVAVRFIEFRVLSNYGSPYTCLYRFRVHGLKADAVFKQTLGVRGE